MHRRHSDSNIPSMQKTLFAEFFKTPLGDKKSSDPFLPNSSPANEDTQETLLAELINEHKNLDVQFYLSENSAIIVEYLNAISKSLHDFDLVFKSDTTGRIFWEVEPILKPHGRSESFLFLIDKILRNEKIISCFHGKYLPWQPIMSAKNITHTKEEIVNYFFKPIEESLEWQDFKTNALEKYTPKKQRQIRDMIAGALTYKILLLWCNQFDCSESQDKVNKTSIFAKMVSLIGYPKILISKQVDLVKTLIKNELNNLFLTLTNKNNKPNEIAEYNVVKKRIRAIRNNDLFCTILSSERILQESLTLFINQLKDSKASKEMTKVTAEQILLDLNKRYMKRASKKTSQPPFYLIILIERLKPLVSKEVKNECTKLLAYLQSNNIIINEKINDVRLFKSSNKNTKKLSTQSQEHKKLHLPEPNNSPHKPILKHSRYSNSISLFKPERHHHHLETKQALTTRSEGKNKKINRKYSNPNHSSKGKRRNSSHVENRLLLRTSGPVDIAKRAKSDIDAEEVKKAKTLILRRKY